MNNLQLFIDWFFNLLSYTFKIITSHWLLGLFLLIWLLSLIVDIFVMVKGSR